MDRTGMKRADVLVLGGAIVAASGALVLLDTAVTSVPEPILASAIVSPEPLFALPSVPGAISGVFESEGKQVPLPPGKWVVMRRTVSPYGPATGASHAPVVSTVLFRLQGHRIDAAILLQVNPPEATSNWGLASGCERRDFYYTDIRYVSDHDSACSYVTYVTPWATSAPAIDDAWRLSMQQAVDNGWDVPQQWLSVVYRMTDPMDAIQVRYLFDPSASGAGGKDITSDEVSRLVAWSDASWRMVQTGFFGHLKPGGVDTLGEWKMTRTQPLALWQIAAVGDAELAFQLVDEAEVAEVGVQGAAQAPAVGAEPGRIGEVELALAGGGVVGRVHQGRVDQEVGRQFLGELDGAAVRLGRELLLQFRDPGVLAGQFSRHIGVLGHGLHASGRQQRGKSSVK